MSTCTHFRLVICLCKHHHCPYIFCKLILNQEDSYIWLPFILCIICLTHVWFQVKTEKILSLARHGFDQENLSAICQHFNDLDAYKRALSTEETDKIYHTSINDLHEICVNLYKRAVVEMVTRVKERSMVLIGDFKKTWFANVDRHETASQIHRRGGRETIKRKLKEIGEYCELWSKFLTRKDNQVQIMLHFTCTFVVFCGHSMIFPNSIHIHIHMHMHMHRLMIFLNSILSTLLICSA